RHERLEPALGAGRNVGGGTKCLDRDLVFAGNGAVSAGKRRERERASGAELPGGGTHTALRIERDGAGLDRFTLVRDRTRDRNRLRPRGSAADDQERTSQVGESAKPHLRLLHHWNTALVGAPSCGFAIC